MKDFNFWNTLCSALCRDSEIKSDEAEKYMDKLLELSREQPEKKRTGNALLDTCIEYEVVNAQQCGTRLSAEITVPNRLPFDEKDICFVLGGFFKGAKEALEALPEDERYINISMGYRKHTLKISMEYPYAERLKKKKRNKLLEDIMKKYNGLIDISILEKSVVTKALFYEML